MDADELKRLTDKVCSNIRVQMPIVRALPKEELKKVVSTHFECLLKIMPILEEKCGDPQEASEIISNLKHCEDLLNFVLPSKTPIGHVPNPTLFPPSTHPRKE